MKPWWFDIFEDPGVVLILGARGSGKTALAHKLAEIYHENTDRKVYVFGFPQDKAHLLPEWMNLLNDIDLPQHSVVLVHEAHMSFHARRSMQDTNVLMDTLITISRHRDCTIIFETQQSFRLDKNIVAEADAIIIRYPSLLQERFERPFIKEFFTVASRFFNKYVKVMHVDDGIYKKPDKDKILRVAYVFSKNYMGPLRDITLPKHWSEELSRVYGYVPENAANPVKQLLMNPDVREILKNAIEIEEEKESKGYNPTWEAWEVGINNPSLIRQLKKLGVIRVAYKSNRRTKYQLVDREMIKRMLYS